MVNRLIASDPYEAMATVAIFFDDERGDVALGWLRSEGERAISQSLEDGDIAFYRSERIQALCEAVIEARDRLSVE